MRISPFETARSKAAVSSNSEGYARKISGAAFAGSGNSAKPNPALASFPFSARAQFRAVSGLRAETLKYRESDAPNHFAAISAFSIRASLNGRRSKASVLNGAVFTAKNAATHIGRKRGGESRAVAVREPDALFGKIHSATDSLLKIFLGRTSDMKANPAFIAENRAVSAIGR